MKFLLALRADSRSANKSFEWKSHSSGSTFSGLSLYESRSIPGYVFAAWLMKSIEPAHVTEVSLL
jgi:hypothetical protein